LNSNSSLNCSSTFQWVSLAQSSSVELLLDLPVGQLGAVEQHDAAGQATVDDALGTGARPAHDGFVLHVARQQFPDVGDGEDVRVDDHGASLVAHQLRGQEAGRREGLQVVVQPGALDAVAQIELALPGGEKRIVPGVRDAHIELVVVLRIAPQRVFGDQGADNLLVVGLDEYAMLHRFRVLTAACRDYK
jgi:hypothetical protein